MSDTPTTEIAVRQEGAAPSMLNFIATALNDPNIDVTKLQALLDMQRQVISEEAKALFNQAFLRLQAKMPRIRKNGVLEYPVDKNKPDGPKRQISKFARWEDIDTAIRPLLDEEGFALSFNTQPRQGDGGGLLVTAILRHSAGHSQETCIPVPLDTSGGKNNLQGYGSTLSYGKRYAASAALNFITEGEDDDGVLGGKAFITSDQQSEILALLNDTKTDTGRFLEVMAPGVASVPEIEKRDFGRLVNALEIKKRKAAGTTA